MNIYKRCAYLPLRRHSSCNVYISRRLSLHYMSITTAAGADDDDDDDNDYDDDEIDESLMSTQCCCVLSGESIARSNTGKQPAALAHLT